MNNRENEEKRMKFNMWFWGYIDERPEEIPVSFLYDRKMRPIIQKRSARMRTRRILFQFQMLLFLVFRRQIIGLFIQD